MGGIAQCTWGEVPGGESGAIPPGPNKTHGKILDFFSFKMLKASIRIRITEE